MDHQTGLKFPKKRWPSPQWAGRQLVHPHVFPLSRAPRPTCGYCHRETAPLDSMDRLGQCLGCLAGDRHTRGSQHAAALATGSSLYAAIQELQKTEGGVEILTITVDGADDAAVDAVLHKLVQLGAKPSGCALRRSGSAGASGCFSSPAEPARSRSGTAGCPQLCPAMLNPSSAQWMDGTLTAEAEARRSAELAILGRDTAHHRVDRHRPEGSGLEALIADASTFWRNGSERRQRRCSGSVALRHKGGGRGEHRAGPALDGRGQPAARVQSHRLCVEVGEPSVIRPLRQQHLDHGLRDVVVGTLGTFTSWPYGGHRG